MTANLKDVREALATLINDVNAENSRAQRQFVAVSNKVLKEATGRAAAVLSQMETPAPQSGGSPAGDCIGKNTQTGEYVFDQLATSPQPLDGVTVEVVRYFPLLRKALTGTCGIIVEFGDLNGFRNLSDQELGKLVITAAENCARLLNETEHLHSASKEET